MAGSEAVRPEMAALAILWALLDEDLPTAELRHLVAAIGGQAAFLAAIDWIDLHLADEGGIALIWATRDLRRRLREKEPTQQRTASDTEEG